MRHSHLKKAKAWADTDPKSESSSLRSIAHALIVVAEELKTANTLKILELKGKADFKLKPIDLDTLFSLEKENKKR